MNQKMSGVREGERRDGCLCCHEGKQRMREKTFGVTKDGGRNLKGAEEGMLEGGGQRKERQITPN